ncbi:MAG: integrase family protein [Mycobacterium sp.]|jgi:integrase|nr:integrase family protein [Mycobacterium sp.]
MADRRQLPPQIRRVELTRRSGGKPVVRYQLTVDNGAVDGKRKQLRRRYATEKDARSALARIQGQVAAGSFVQPSKLTVEQACADWLRSRHKIRPTTGAGYEYILQPVRGELGELNVQDLTRRHIDDLILKLRNGELRRADGRLRKKWSARSCNYMVGAISQVLAQLVAEGRLTRNVALLVDRVPGKPKKFQTFTPEQVQVVLKGIADNRNRHAWHLALAGLRRGEIAGQRWEDIDLEKGVVRIRTTRVDVGGRALDQDEPKTAAADRPLPIPPALLVELKAAKARQAAEKLALGEAYEDKGYVVCDEAGQPYHPSTLTKLWNAAIRDLDVPQVRLHDARHTCATLMHLQNVPIALIAAWLGHADVSFTLRTYVHAQPEALSEAAESFTRLAARKSPS